MKKHFIDNLVSQLNCISRISTLENAAKTNKQVDLLINFIKYKFWREGQIIRLKREIETARNFLDMFKARFGENFKYSIDVKDEYNDIYIPHYTIMTFVENSMYHALENMEDIWELKITAKEDSDGVKILIMDNGTGFNTEPYVKAYSKNREYGSIASTISRLSEFFKSEETVRIKSSNKGTIVSVNIPHFSKEI